MWHGTPYRGCQSWIPYVVRDGWRSCIQLQICHTNGIFRIKRFHVHINVVWCLSKGQRDKERNGADQLWRTTDPWQQWLSHFQTTYTCGLDWFWSTDWKRLPWYFSFVTKNQRVLFVVFMTSPFHIDISMICSKLTQPCIRLCGKLCRNKDYRCFFLCTNWVFQHPFRPQVFIDNRRVLWHRLPYYLTVVWVWSNKESVEYRRSRHHCNSRPRLDSLGQYTWLVVSKPCFPANLQRYTLIFKMWLWVWESLLLPTEQCLQCLWGRENIFVSFQLLLCYCFSSTLQFTQLPIDELQVL